MTEQQQQQQQQGMSKVVKVTTIRSTVAKRIVIVVSISFLFWYLWTTVQLTNFAPSSFFFNVISPRNVSRYSYILVFRLKYIKEGYDSAKRGVNLTQIWIM